MEYKTFASTPAARSGPATSTKASVYFGVSLGILRVISNALQNIESILQIVLDKTVEVAEDCNRATTGDLQLPSSGELVELVYH